MTRLLPEKTLIFKTKELGESLVREVRYQVISDLKRLPVHRTQFLAHTKNHPDILGNHAGLSPRIREFLKFFSIHALRKRLRSEK